MRRRCTLAERYWLKDETNTGTGTGTLELLRNQGLQDPMMSKWLCLTTIYQKRNELLSSPGISAVPSSTKQCRKFRHQCHRRLPLWRALAFSQSRIPPQQLRVGRAFQTPNLKVNKGYQDPVFICT